MTMKTANAMLVGIINPVYSCVSADVISQIMYKTIERDLPPDDEGAVRNRKD